MKAAPIFIVIAAGSMLGWFSPDVPATGTFAEQAGDDALPLHAPSRRDTLQQQQQWSASEVVLERSGDGHFYADVAIDGSTSNMLVDTGASVIALTGDDAAAMGVTWDEADVRPVASGASGAVYGVHVRLDNVRLGGLEASGVDAVVVPEGLDVSLLGQSFLSRIEKVEIDRERMVLGG